MKLREVALALVMGGAVLPAGVLADTRPLPGPTWTIQDKRAILWKVVQECVKAPDVVPTAGSDPHPNSCTKVDVNDGYVILKDNSPAKPYAFLLLPTTRVTGIEDSQLWMDNGPNYWRAAYENRGLVEQRLKARLLRTQVGFAANSVYGRSQDQLHIHMTCVRPDVARKVAGNLHRLSEGKWTNLPPMAGRKHRYRARLTSDAALSRTDPVQLLASDVYPKGAMLPHTLFMLGVTLPNGQPGFVFLDTQADAEVRQGSGTNDSNWGSAEELLDNSCAIAGTGGATGSK